MAWGSDSCVAVHYDEVVHTTDQAALLRIDEDEVWFPFSVCVELGDVSPGDGEGVFDCPEWLALKKGQI